MFVWDPPLFAFVVLVFPSSDCLCVVFVLLYACLFDCFLSLHFILFHFRSLASFSLSLSLSHGLDDEEPSPLPSPPSSSSAAAFSSTPFSALPAASSNPCPSPSSSSSVPSFAARRLSHLQVSIGDQEELHHLMVSSLVLFIRIICFDLFVWLFPSHFVGKVSSMMP